MAWTKKLAMTAGLAMTFVALPAMAHHSFAMFDQTKLLNMSDVTVTNFTWTNPHTFVVVEVKGVKYVMECNSVNMLRRSGWKANTLKAGDKVQVAFHPLRTGKPGGMLKSITLPNGNTMSAW